jgi:DNA polymerase-1
MLIGGDYSQLELRVLAYIAEDKVMQGAYQNGQDLHSVTGAALAGVPIEAFDPESNPEHAQSRRRAKAINFGISYGGGADGIQQVARDSYGVIMSLAEAEQFRQQWLRQYPGVARWQEAQTRATGSVSTLGGRDYSFDWEAYGQYRPTLAVNLPVQGSAAEIVMEAMALLHERLLTCPGNPGLINQIHDEFIIEVDDQSDCDAVVSKLLGACMTEAFQSLMPGAPIMNLCNIASGRSWHDIH